METKQFNSNKYRSISLKGCVLEVDLEYPKEFRELCNDYSLAPDKTEIKKKILSNYKLKISDLYNNLVGNAKKLAPKFFYIEKYVLHYENLHFF